MTAACAYPDSTSFISGGWVRGWPLSSEHAGASLKAQTSVDNQARLETQAPVAHNQPSSRGQDNLCRLSAPKQLVILARSVNYQHESARSGVSKP